ncbi:uncharacterized protein HaLaN_27214, partial [Haematococcus lacustris]
MALQLAEDNTPKGGKRDCIIDELGERSLGTAEFRQGPSNAGPGDGGWVGAGAGSKVEEAREARSQLRLGVTLHCGPGLGQGGKVTQGVGKVRLVSSSAGQLVNNAKGCQKTCDSPKQSRRTSNVPGQLPGKVRSTLMLDSAMRGLAAQLKDEHSLMFFARGYNYATALEAALKIKEVALIHSEGILAGEMKHGPLAL